VSALDVDAHMHEKWDRVLTYLVEPRSSAKVGSVRDGIARGSRTTRDRRDSSVLFKRRKIILRTVMVGGRARWGRR
jgi:hypothetical protein